MTTTIKGTRQELMIGKKKLSILEFGVKSKRISYTEIKTIEYQSADNSKCGFIRFKLNTGDNEIFVFRKKRNEAVTQSLGFIASSMPNITIIEVSEPFTLNDRFNLWSMRKKVLYFAILIGILATSFYVYIETVSDLYHSGNAITLTEYNDCKTGMTYEQCVKIIGQDGEPFTETEILDTRSASYVWYGNEMTGANAVFIFQDDKLISKSQIGLE